ncbi:MAG: hypothetical protein FWE19_00390 [Oscillospiraceae bacterium]|nr:hypothetical protein [Oscillospiraceae bacterium]
MKQLFIVNQDRDRIYPMEKEFVHIGVQITDGVCMGFQIKLAGLLLGTYDNARQAQRIKQMITNFGGRKCPAFFMPGYHDYNTYTDWLEILAMYQEIESREAK